MYSKCIIKVWEEEDIVKVKPAFTCAMYHQKRWLAGEAMCVVFVGLRDHFVKPYSTAPRCGALRFHAFVKLTW